MNEDDSQTPLELFKGGSFKFGSSPKSVLGDKPMNIDLNHKESSYFDQMDPISDRKEEEPAQSAKKSTAVESSVKQALEDPQMYDHEDSPLSEPESNKIIDPVTKFEQNRTQEFKIQNIDLERKSENNQLEAQNKNMEVDKQEYRYITNLPFMIMYNQ